MFGGVDVLQELTLHHAFYGFLLRILFFSKNYCAPNFSVVYKLTSCFLVCTCWATLLSNFVLRTTRVSLTHLWLQTSYSLYSVFFSFGNEIKFIELCYCVMYNFYTLVIIPRPQFNCQHYLTYFFRAPPSRFIRRHCFYSLSSAVDIRFVLDFSWLRVKGFKNIGIYFILMCRVEASRLYKLARLTNGLSKIVDSLPKINTNTQSVRLKYKYFRFYSRTKSDDSYNSMFCFFGGWYEANNA